MRVLIVLLLLVPAPAAAQEICDDLWFTRNLVYHHAGYCFGSILGKAVFGNAGCTTTEPELSGAERDFIADIKRLEDEWQCVVDTGRRELAVPAIASRIRMRDLPVVTGTETGCAGWRGGRAILRAGRDSIAPLTGAVHDGDTLLFRFADVGAWSFVEVMRGDRLLSAGWARIEIGEQNCDFVAG